MSRRAYREELTDNGTIYSTSCQDISAIPAEVEAIDGLDGAALTDTFFKIFQPFGQIVSGVKMSAVYSQYRADVRHIYVVVPPGVSNRKVSPGPSSRTTAMAHPSPSTKIYQETLQGERNKEKAPRDSAGRLFQQGCDLSPFPARGLSLTQHCGTTLANLGGPKSKEILEKFERFQMSLWVWRKTYDQESGSVRREHSIYAYITNGIWDSMRGYRKR